MKEIGRRKIIGGSVSRARALRKRSTTAEKMLWQKLRNRRLRGLKFRRQTPIKPYIVDFYCPEKLLVIEVDGSWHYFRSRYDARRTAYLETLGLKVIRFRNGQIREHLGWVLETITEHCGFRQDIK